MKIEQLIEDNKIFEELYDIIRIIDPFTKVVYDTKFMRGYEKKIIGLSDMKYCYDIWGDNAVCENCVSARAINEKKVFMKTEFNGKDVYIVTSILIEHEGKKLILEVVNEITEKGLYDELQGKDYFEIKKALKEKNLQMVTDELTGAYNRRFINERLLFEMIFYSTYKENIVISMADIDFFKNVNDTYGHDAGDYILKEVVNIIKDNIRIETDWIARYGGEEFIIFHKNISNEKAFEKLNDIRGIIETNDFVYYGKTIKITVSFGMKEYNCEKEITEWIKKADKNLYISKNSGRNKVTWE